MPPTIRTRRDVCGNIEAIETYHGRAKGPGEWKNILAEPIQRGDVSDLIASLAPTCKRCGRLINPGPMDSQDFCSAECLNGRGGDASP